MCRKRNMWPLYSCRFCDSHLKVLSGPMTPLTQPSVAVGNTWPMMASHLYVMAHYPPAGHPSFPPSCEPVFVERKVGSRVSRKHFNSSAALCVYWSSAKLLHPKRNRAQAEGTVYCSVSDLQKEDKEHKERVENSRKHKNCLYLQM